MECISPRKQKINQICALKEITQERKKIRMKQKSLFAVMLTVVMIMGLLSGCGNKVSAKSNATKTDKIQVTTDETYNKMTSEQLYEQAKKEKGKIVVYCTSSKIEKAAEKFMKEYPNLKVEVNDLNAGESITKVVAEQDANKLTCDVVQDSDSLGNIAYNYYGKYLSAYYPKEICSHIEPSLLTYGMPLYSSISYWFYNTKAYPNGSPVSNWWDIVEKKSDGTQVYDLYCKDFGSEDTYLALLSNFVANPKPLEEAYKEKYHKDIEYTYDAKALGVEDKNAGYELLYRFSQLKMTFISDGDEIVQAVANSDASKPALGLASAGKITNKDENGYQIGWVTKLSPYVSTQNTSYVYTTTKTDNPAGARLFIWYLCGGADGKNEGYQSLMKEGSWSIRTDYKNEKNPFSLADSDTIPSDLKGVYKNYLDVSDFWTYWRNKSPNK